MNLLPSPGAAYRLYFLNLFLLWTARKAFSVSDSICSYQPCHFTWSYLACRCHTGITQSHMQRERVNKKGKKNTSSGQFGVVESTMQFLPDWMDLMPCYDNSGHNLFLSMSISLNAV